MCYLNDTLYCYIVLVFGLLRLNRNWLFPTTSHKLFPSSGYPIAVTKLSFPNLWNYIRFSMYQPLVLSCPNKYCASACSFCFIVSDLVFCGIMFLRFIHYWKGKNFQFTIGDNLPMQQVLNAFPFHTDMSLLEKLFPSHSTPSTIYYRWRCYHLHISISISNGNINLPDDSYHLS